MNILILDDREVRHDYFAEQFKNEASLHHVYNVEDCITALESIDFDEVYLDHDLNGGAYEPSDDDSGFAVARWLSNNPHRKPKRIVIHSMNYEGAMNMKWLLPEAEIKPCKVY